MQDVIGLGLGKKREGSKRAASFHLRSLSRIYPPTLMSPLICPLIFTPQFVPSSSQLCSCPDQGQGVGPKEKKCLGCLLSAKPPQPQE